MCAINQKAPRRAKENVLRSAIMHHTIIQRTAQCLILFVFILLFPNSSVYAEESFPLHRAASKGEIKEIEKLIVDAYKINLQDTSGKTALHYAAENGHGQTVAILLEYGSDATLKDNDGLTAYDYALRNGHERTATILKSYSGLLQRIIKPSLKYRTQDEFESTIDKPACLLKDENVWFFAPEEHEAAAKIIFSYLVKAYDELNSITGIHTEYIVVIYNFPKGHKDAFGGTSNCVIYYDDSNLHLNTFEEWNKYGVPHISGYVEEMAHDFVHASGVQFGWEMIGWSIGTEVMKRVLPNPVFLEGLKQTRQGQLETYKRYRKGNYTFPQDIPANQVDRIHAFLLWRCEQKYGAGFWESFFGEVKKRHKDFEKANELEGGDTARNRRYQLSIECFDALDKIDFKEMLVQNEISLTTDIKSLCPENSNWDRKLH
jgi:hypothetical protein